MCNPSCIQIRQSHLSREEVINKKVLKFECLISMVHSGRLFAIFSHQVTWVLIFPQVPGVYETRYVDARSTVTEKKALTEYLY